MKNIEYMYNWTICVSETISAISSRQLLGPSRLASQALGEGGWIEDFSGTLNVQGISEYLHLAEIIHAQSLSPGTEGQLIWNFTVSHNYSAKSAYGARFEGTPESPIWGSIWES